MHFYGRLPEEAGLVRSWSIYDLVDDWIVRSSVKPEHQILFFLVCIAGAAGVMIWITKDLTSFPEMPLGIYIVLQVVLLFVTIAVHELCHALMILYYGGRPGFGAKWMKGLGPVVYATTKGFFTVHAYRRIAAAPLIIISVMCMIGVFFGAGWWLLVPFIFNAVGAGGDLLSLRVLKRYPSDFIIEDTQDGFSAYKNMISERSNESSY